MDWKQLIQAVGPVALGMATKGQHGAVLRGYMSEQDRIADEQRQQQQESQRRRQVGASMSMELMGRLQQETDPVRFEQLRNTITTHADAYGIDPQEFASLPLPSGSDAKLRELTLMLDGLAKGGYDLDQLAETGAVVPMKDGTRIPVSDALKLTRTSPEDASGQMVPAPKKADAAASTDYGRFLARYAKDKGKRADELSAAEELDARKQFQTIDDRPLTTPDPQLATLRGLQIEGQRLRNQKASEPDAPKGDGLPTAVISRVQSRISNFDNLPAVKNTQTMAEAASFAQSLNPNTKNSADDQALIYAYAKAMDPNSVVREGEYATVQRYAQSWAQSIGFDAARVFSNTPFLTPQARQNMKSTILQKFNAARGQYDVIRKSYASQINKITGMDDGDSWLTDYAGAFPGGGSSAAQPFDASTIKPVSSRGGTSQASPGTVKIGRFEVVQQ